MSTSAIVTDFIIHSMFKIYVSLKLYVTSVTNKHIRDISVRFTVGASNIRLLQTMIRCKHARLSHVSNL